MLLNLVTAVICDNSMKIVSVSRQSKLSLFTSFSHEIEAKTVENRQKKRPSRRRSVLSRLEEDEANQAALAEEEKRRQIEARSSHLKPFWADLWLFSAVSEPFSAYL